MKKIIVLILFAALLIVFVAKNIEDNDFKVSHTIIESKDDVKNINVVLPIFEGFNGAEEVNRRIESIASDAIEDANLNAEYMSDYKKELIEKGEPVDFAAVSLEMVYDYLQAGEILSVQLSIYSYSGGAHGISHIVSITSNTETGEIYEFKNLFKDNIDYDSIISNYIIDEIENNPDLYYEDYMKSLPLDGNYNYYIDGDKLVVYFGLYDIAPYAAGLRHFTIDSSEIKDILKKEIYNSIKDGVGPKTR